MKNLLNKMSLEELEIVPIEHLANRPTQATKSEYFGWHRRDRDMHKVDGVSPYDRASRIIEHNLGKSFDMAFSYYCKLVPKYQQRVFLEKFEGNYRRMSSAYIIDENGNIQDNSDNPYKEWYRRRRMEYKGPYNFKSDDYAVELRHKITGHKKSDFEEVYEKETYQYKSRYLPMSGGKRSILTGIRQGKLLYYEYGTNPFKMKPLAFRYKAKDSDFEAVIVKGWEKLFDSKNDPEFKKLMAERNKKKFISLKRQRIQQAEKAYSMISKTELKKKEEALLNRQNILRHGFDPISSFRGVQQTII